LRYEQGRFQVGPQSAGANPGPRSYRRGGPLCITDANVLLGRIQPGHFPAIFGPNGDEPLDIEAVRAAFAALAQEVGDGRAPEEVAEGFLRIATENMASAIKKISIQRGRDVTQYLLNCFGGAGAQFACRIADALGMEKVLVHPLAGVLSAYGIGLANIRAERTRGLELPLDDEGLKRTQEEAEALAQEALAELAEKGVPPAEAEVRKKVLVRYLGTDTALEVPLAGSVPSLRAAFEVEHERLFSFTQPEKPLIIEAVVVEAEGGGARPPEQEQPLAQGAPEPLEQADLYVQGRWQKVPLYTRAAMRPGQQVSGPCIIIEPNSQIVIEPGWAASMNAYGHLLLERATPRSKAEAIGTQATRCCWRSSTTSS
jgi:5-oxoprolinase (ATP-hydrolysing)